jgi:hypothetical protein
LLGRGTPQDLELARDAVDEAMESLLGNMARVIPSLDATTAAGLLHDPERVLGYAWLLGLQASLCRAGGDETEARRLEARSLTCYRAAVRLEPDLATVWNPRDPPGVSPA